MAILYCDGGRFREAFLAGASWLAEYEVILNQLNVFPKPDGDTGTNMSLTLLSGVHELRDREDAPLEKVLEAAARGTLMGAKGSSGVMLSQIIAGFAEVGRGKTKLNPQDIAAGFQLGSERAYRAVVEPVEGTLLTVIRESSEEAVKFAKVNNDIIQLLEATLNRAKMSLKNSPNLLPVLAQTGLVDAGGQGLVYILEGVLRMVRNGHILSSYQHRLVSPSLATTRAQIPESWNNPYCTEFLLIGTDADISSIRKSFGELGGDLAVVGWDELLRVHIHTSDPEKVLACAHSYGEPLSVKIDDTRKQYRFAVQPQSKSQRIKEKRERISIVMTAPGDGIKAVCISLGAESVVMHDQTRALSVSELIHAIDDAYCNEVLTLPNNSNIIPTAMQAASMSDKHVEVIPSKNISQGILALAAFRPDASVSDNVNNMNMALSEVKHGEIAHAARNARYGDLIVRENDIIGLFNGNVRVAEEDHNAAVLGLLRIMVEQDDEVITIFYGVKIQRNEAEKTLGYVESAFPEKEIKLRYGGQLICSYILSVERGLNDK